MDWVAGASVEPGPGHPSTKTVPHGLEGSTMSNNVFTLDALRQEVERQYSPVTVTLADGTDVTLRNLLRLDRKDRDKVMESLKQLEDTDSITDGDVDSVVDAAFTVLELVAEKGGKKLVTELEGDIPLTMKVLETWMAASQPGEATRSEG